VRGFVIAGTVPPAFGSRRAYPAPARQQEERVTDEQRIGEWFDANVGGTVVAIQRQPR
jgi:hypothetical protein